MEEDYYYCTNAAIRPSSGGGRHIPTFGNWDFTNDLPITQYFDCARQATTGLVRYSSSSGECDPRAAVDLYSSVVGRDPAFNASASRNQRRPHVKEQKKGGRIYDVTEQPRKMRHVSQKHNVKNKVQSDAVPYPRPRISANKPPKAVDEDLYQIPPELLNPQQQQKKKKMKKKLGFISKCLVPACAA